MTRQSAETPQKARDSGFFTGDEQTLQTRKRTRRSAEFNARLFGGRRRKAVERNRDRFSLAPEAPPSHPDIAEQSDPGIRSAEVRGELPVRLQRLPIRLAPSLEHRMKFVRLLRPYRQSRAAAKRVDRHPPGPIEPEAMTAWNMAQPAMGELEVGRLEAKPGDHWRNVQIANQLP